MVESTMRTKKEIRDELVNDPIWQSALNSVDGEEKKKIVSAVEPLLIDLISSMDEFMDALKADPEAIAELSRGLTGEKQVVNSEPVASGSTG